MVASSFEPAYRRLGPADLDRRAAEAVAHLRACDLCPRACGFNRLEGPGVCHAGRLATVSSFFPHHGEEDPLRGTRGSGTIFFSWCNLRCTFCQNFEISQLGQGRAATAEQIAGMMLHLQAVGCHNINLVTPSHVVPQILEAVAVAARQGLRLPLVYNTGGYDALCALQLLDGIVDIYMPDMKYADSATARRYSKIMDYAAHNRAAVCEMHHQVGDLVLNDRGIAQRGLLVRHLVLPGGLAGTQAIMQFLAEEVSRDTYVNIMAQYRPAYRASQSKGLLGRAVIPAEVVEAYALARSVGLHRFDR